MGQIFDGGINISYPANETIATFLNATEDSSLRNPFIVLNLGDVRSRSSQYTKWIVSSTPSYSYLKPWWISILSATILESDLIKIDSTLLPGFCPFVPQYTSQNLYDVQNLLTNSISSNGTLITFVYDTSIPLPPTSPTTSTGVFQFATSRDPVDKWMSVSMGSNGQIIFENQDYSKHGIVVVALVLSLVIGAYISFISIGVFIVAKDHLFGILLKSVKHVKSYSNIPEANMNKNEDEVKNENGGGLTLNQSQVDAKKTKNENEAKTGQDTATSKGPNKFNKTKNPK